MKKVPLFVRKNFYFYEIALIKQKGGERCHCARPLIIWRGRVDKNAMNWLNSYKKDQRPNQFSFNLRLRSLSIYPHWKSLKSAFYHREINFHFCVYLRYLICLYTEKMILLKILLIKGARFPMIKCVKMNVAMMSVCSALAGEEVGATP